MIPRNEPITNISASIFPIATAHTLVPGQKPPITNPNPIIKPPIIADQRNVGLI